MPEVPPIFVVQLKETCKLSGARWAVWLKRNQKTWECFQPGYLSKARLATIKKMIQQSDQAAWLAGTLSSGRTRSCQAGLFSENLGCQRLFAFPNKTDRAILLVGAGDLDKVGLRFFQTLALDSPIHKDESERQTNLSEILAIPDNFSFASPLSPEKILNHLLQMLIHIIPCDAAFLAIHWDENYRVDAIWNLPQSILSSNIPVRDDPILEEIIRNKQGKIINDPSRFFKLWNIHTNFKEATGSCLVAPVLSGERIISLAVLISSSVNEFLPTDILKASRYFQQVVHATEGAILFRGVSHFLQQFSLLSEVTSTDSYGGDTYEIARNVVERLRMGPAETETTLYLISGDEKRLRVFNNGINSSEDIKNIPLDGTLAGYVIQTGQAMRSGEPRDPWLDFARDMNQPSILVVPLVHQGRRFGAIRLDSEQHNAFSPQDEQILSVFANHLATLLENLRLFRDARLHTLNLSLIHQVVQQVVGLKDVLEIAQKTAELISDYFKYEFSVVLVSEEDGEVLMGAGVGGTSAHLLTPGFRYPSDQGLTGRVFQNGISFFSNDISQEPDYFTLSGLVAGSEICVPLREGSRVFGLINVERAKKDAFTDQDLQMLESLAGILSSVMMNAQRYQELARLYAELQDSIKAHQATELQLVRSARMAAIGELAAGVAHELNNPLTTIAGFVELVMEEIPPERQEYEDLSLVLRETRRAVGVVRQLLDFSRQTEKSQDQIDLNELSKDVLTFIQHLIKTSGVQIKLDLFPDLPKVQADPNQMKQVLLNLIQNALQAMPYGGSLTIGTTEKLNHQGQIGVALMIKDTGEGIPPENLGRIFEPFFTTRPAGVGTGLGLPVSYGIVTNYGGTIEVESQVGFGSCFTIWLPQNKDEVYA